MACFDSYFLPVTKVTPTELFRIVGPPLIQYAADIDILIFVTGLNKRVIANHFHADNELKNMPRAKGKERCAG